MWSLRNYADSDFFQNKNAKKTLWPSWIFLDKMLKTLVSLLQNLSATEISNGSFGESGQLLLFMRSGPWMNRTAFSRMTLWGPMVLWSLQGFREREVAGAIPEGSLCLFACRRYLYNHTRYLCRKLALVWIIPHQILSPFSDKTRRWLRYLFNYSQEPGV